MHILREYLNKFIAVYFDNVIIFLKDLSKHTEHVREVMRKLHDAGLSLNIDKCKFNVTEVEYLGLVFTLEGLKIPTKKVNTILD
jgi:ribosome-interacting GTPase 1